MTTAVLTSLPLRKLTTDAGTQLRAAINDSTVDEYMECLADLPAVIVFRDGNSYFLADGFHRVLAHERAGQKHVMCDVRRGDRRDAIKFAASANRQHGLRLTSADKRHAVGVFLDDEELSQMSSREIAELTGASHQTVLNLKSERNPSCQKLTPKPEKAPAQIPAAFARIFQELPPEAQQEMVAEAERQAGLAATPRGGARQRGEWRPCPQCRGKGRIRA